MKVIALIVCLSAAAVTFASDPHVIKDAKKAAASPAPHDKTDASKGVQSSAQGEAHWDYKGEHGPDHWGDMKGEFATCKLGKEQSPIDLLPAQISKTELPMLQTAYADAALAILNNGHTVQVNYKGDGWLVVGRDSYRLLQFHFHAPSEEKINGKAADMVAHFVHKNSKGELAVVGVLINKGSANSAFDTVLKKLPTQAGGEQIFGDQIITFSRLLPADRAYYTFKGSLTTPPCSEGVRWFVLKTPITLSAEQIALFTAIYPNNARPVQALNDRKIEQTP